MRKKGSFLLHTSYKNTSEDGMKSLKFAVEKKNAKKSSYYELANRREGGFLASLCNDGREPLA